VIVWGGIDNYESYIGKLSECYRAQYSEINFPNFDFINEEVSDLFKKLNIDNKIASNDFTPTLSPSQKSLNLVDHYLFENPDEIYNYHVNIQNLKLGGYLSLKGSKELLDAGYDAFDRYLISQLSEAPVNSDKTNIEIPEPNGHFSGVSGLEDLFLLLTTVLAYGEMQQEDEDPEIIITTSQSSISENSSSSITLTFTLRDAGPTTLTVALGGSASSASDYSIGSTSLSIASCLSPVKLCHNLIETEDRNYG